DYRDPVLGRTLTGTHTGLGGLRSDRLVGEYLYPDLAAALGLARHGDTGGLYLIGGYPAGLLSLEPVFTVGNDVAASGLALHAAALHPAVLDSLGHQHQLLPPSLVSVRGAPCVPAGLGPRL